MRKLVDRVRDALQRPPPPPAAPATGPADVVMLGHSHAYAVWRGYHAAPPPFSLAFFDMLGADVAAAIAATTDGVVPALRQFLAAHPEAPALLSFGGNEHNQLALVEHPEPFDFHQPGGAPVDGKRRLIPAGAMRAFFAPYLQRPRQLMAGFRTLAPTRPAWLLLPPPPNPDTAHIQGHAHGFAEKVASDGVAPYGVRHKLWLLQCELLRGHAAATGLGVLEPPARTLDADGRLLPQAWGVDAVHASPWYGQQVLQDFVAVRGRCQTAAGA